MRNNGPNWKRWQTWKKIIKINREIKKTKKKKNTSMRKKNDERPVRGYTRTTTKILVAGKRWWLRQWLPDSPDWPQGRRGCELWGPRGRTRKTVSATAWTEAIAFIPVRGSRERERKKKHKIQRGEARKKKRKKNENKTNCRLFLRFPSFSRAHQSANLCLHLFGILVRNINGNRWV